MSCKHGNWPPCDLCDEIDAAYEAGRKDAASQPIAGKPVGIVAVSSAGISVGWVENYTPMHNDKLYIHPALSQPAPQGVAEVEGTHDAFEMIETLQGAYLNWGGWSGTMAILGKLKSALTAVVQERDALRADRDMRINHELVLHKVRADLEAHVKLEQDAALISIAAAKEPK